MTPIRYINDTSGYSIEYTSPSRKFSDLRTELNNDAKLISKEHGPVYIAFSSGLDSQVILRCFMDMKLDFIPFFVHSVGYNDFELEVVKESEKFYGINIQKHEVFLKEHQESWIKDSIEKNIPTCIHYPLVHVLNQLPESFPVVTSGANEPCLIGSNQLSIYHNYYEQMRLRFSMIENSRTVLDFPYSCESLASYYCDDTIKTYANISSYFMNNKLVYQHTGTYPKTDYFNAYVKPFVKGKHFHKDILYPSKRTGIERFPLELVRDLSTPDNARISANYHDVVNHLEKCDGTIKRFSTWDYPNH